MQKIESCEAATFKIAGLPVAVALSRPGKLVMFIATEPHEGLADVCLAAREYQVSQRSTLTSYGDSGETGGT